ncbi:MAG: methylglyoxal synthase [Deltaproteobacteria bacterium]|nr:methylglyoxal synthase [Deltaproteobacteria bacterium]
MNTNENALPVLPRKRIALVAHDNKKQDLMEWALYNRDLLVHHELCATGTTGSLLEKALETDVLKLQSGPLGGDQQIGAKIAEGVIDFIIFFWDPLEPQPHDPDVKALLRLAVVWNVPVACNRATADFMISSPLMSLEYERILPDFQIHRNRFENGLNAARAPTVPEVLDAVDYAEYAEAPDEMAESAAF